MENIFKTVIAVVGSLISGMVGGLGLAFTVLVGMMLVDIITGFMVGWVTGQLQSSVGVKGIVKKSYILILIGAIYLLQTVVHIAEFAGDGITIAFIVMEFLSIIENGSKLGIPLPAKVQSALAILKGDISK